MPAAAVGGRQCCQLASLMISKDPEGPVCLKYG